MVARTLVCAAAVLVSAACSSGSSSSPQRIPSAIEVTPSGRWLPLGTSLQLAATAKYSDGGTEDVTATAAWATGDSSIATVSAGLVDPRGLGTAHVSATLAGVTGSAAFDVVSLELLPRVAMTLAPGKTLAMVPVARFADGSSIDVPPDAWDTSNASTASVSAGLVTAVGAGTATITATVASYGVILARDVHVSSARLVSFTTSAAGSFDLSTWSAAGGASGLAAADVICNTLARAAGLPGTFVAWASSSGDDAYCRVHGLWGKRAHGCGRPALPAAAGPWVRTDGKAFRGAFDPVTLISGVPIYSPPRYDEKATLVTSASSDTGVAVLAATTEDGVADLRDCGGWTAASGPGVFSSYGFTNGGRYAWASGGSAGCPVFGSLACFQAGTGAPLPAFSSGKRVFVTSARGSGKLSTWATAGAATGLAAGDAICKALAAAAGLSNASAFKAWLSDDTTDAATRITSSGPWVRMDGAPLAANRADLLDGALEATIDVDEAGRLLDDSFVFTGTTPSGARTASSTCSSWTVEDSVTRGTVGRTSFAGTRWSDQSTFQCNNTSYRLYCFED